MVLRFCSASQIVFLPEALTRPGDRRSIHAEDDADGPKESCFVVVLFVSLWPVAHGLVKASGLCEHARLCLGLCLRTQLTAGNAFIPPALRDPPPLRREHKRSVHKLQEFSRSRVSYKMNEPKLTAPGRSCDPFKVRVISDHFYVGAETRSTILDRRAHGVTISLRYPIRV